MFTLRSSPSDPMPLDPPPATATPRDSIPNISDVDPAGEPPLRATVESARRWTRFSLRTLIAVLVLFSILFGVLVKYDEKKRLDAYERDAVLLQPSGTPRIGNSYVFWRWDLLCRTATRLHVATARRQGRHDDIAGILLQRRDRVQAIGISRPTSTHWHWRFADSAFPDFGTHSLPEIESELTLAIETGEEPNYELAVSRTIELLEAFKRYIGDSRTIIFGSSWPQPCGGALLLPSAADLRYRTDVAMHIAELLPSDRDKVNVLTATRAFLETMRARKVWFAETRSWDGEIARVDAKLAGIANDRRAELDALKRWVENTRIDANADPVFSVDVAEAVVAIRLSHEAKAALARFHDNRSALGNAGKDYVAQLRKLRKSYEESSIHGADKTVDEDYARLIRCVIALHELGAD